MKKLAALTSTALYLLSTVKVWADPVASPGSINVLAPSAGFKTVGDFVSKAITFTLAVGIIIVLVMLVLGAFEWITSGGDKEAVGKARNRIINALIGLAILAVAFALANVGSQFVGIDLKNIVIPTPAPNPTGL